MIELKDGMRWVAISFDSGDGAALGDTPEEAIANYEQTCGIPVHGFYTFYDRETYKTQLEAVASRMGYGTNGSIPLFLAGEWIVVVPATCEACESLERTIANNEKPARSLVRNWAREDGLFCIDDTAGEYFTSQDIPEGWKPEGEPTERDIRAYGDRETWVRGMWDKKVRAYNRQLYMERRKELEKEISSPARMTGEQFACCTTNASKKSADAARLVLVDGVCISVAAAQLGIKEQSVRNALVRIRRRYRAIAAAWDGK